MYANYKEFHVFERMIVMADGRKLHYIGNVSPAIIAAMQSAGVKVR